MKQPKRKKFFIDPTVQLFLVKNTCLNWICFLTIAAALAVCVEVVAQYPDQTLMSIASGVWARHAATLILISTVMPIFIYRSIRLSNRFVGPVWRFRQEVARIANGGEIRSIKFRKGDFWSDLADDYNRVLQRLSSAESQTDKTEEAYALAD